MSTAILFPGQGSQAAGMREIAERHAPELACVAIEATGTDPFERASESTACAQPAILCTSLALWAAAGRPAADYMAGHSLGELTALVAAGAIDPRDGVRLATTRGRQMQAAADDSPGAMAALIGPADRSRELADRFGVEVANDNAPAQIVVAGNEVAIDRLYTGAADAGVKAMRLPVAGAFHTQAMAPAVQPFRKALDEVEIRLPATPVFSCAMAERFPDRPDEIRDLLAAAIVRPVRWRDTVLTLHATGVRRFAEAGPGRALTGMVRRTVDSAEAFVLEPAEVAHV